MRYKIFDPDSKVIGQAMLGFKAAADQDMILPLLEKFNLTDILPDQWYPLQSWLDVLSDISEQTGDYASMMTFVDIGKRVAANILVPETVVRQMGFFQFSQQLGGENYLQNHQGDVGKVELINLDDKHMRIILNTPYPPDFWYGITYGIALKFAGSNFVVHYEDIAMRFADPGSTAVIHLIVE